MIVQWTAYGDSNFDGANGWLASSLRLAHEQGLKLVLGLSMDPAYYQRINELDSAGLASSLASSTGAITGSAADAAQGLEAARQRLVPAAGT